MQLHDSLGPIFTFSSCHNAVLMFWLGTHSTWLGSGRHHLLAYSTCFGHHKHDCRWPDIPSKISDNCHYKHGWKFSRLIKHIQWITLECSPELQPLAWQPCHLQPPPNILFSLQHESQVIHM